MNASVAVWTLAPLAQPANTAIRKEYQMRKVVFYLLVMFIAALPILVLIPTAALIANSSLVFAHQVAMMMPITLALVAWYEYWFSK